jgi:predicted NAD/FAD-dependent oxidoreductase
MSKQINNAAMQPCWSLMIGFDVHFPTQIAYSDDCANSIAVIARKTERSLPVEGWVVQASARWSRAHLELDQDRIISLLLPAFFKALDCDPCHQHGASLAIRSDHNTIGQIPSNRYVSRPYGLR